MSSRQQDMTSNHQEALTLLKQWLNGIKIAHIAHSRAAARYNLRGRMLGLPATIFSVVVGTSIFSTLNSSPDQWVLLLVGVISMVAAVLSGLQTFLNYPELAEKHRIACVKYGSLRRYAEEIVAFTRDSGELKKAMNKLRNDWNQVEEEAPEIPQELHDRVLRFVKPELAEQRENKGQGT